MFVTVCIPTYRRPHLLQLLLQDILKQSIRPDHLIIVDGDPASGDVLDMLSEIKIDVPLTYIPSNHGNLAYQRYLGWRAAADTDTDFLIYFDDDQRIFQPDVLSWLTAPLETESAVVGVGCFSRVPDHGHDPAMDHLMTRTQTHALVRRFGSSRSLHLQRGFLTPTGHRIGLIDNRQNYVETSWLQGRIMAYRMSAMSEATFSDDLFATYERRIGRAEDTFLSRRVGRHGTMLFTFRAVVDHPNADTPKAYSVEAKKFAYAAIYSRRLLNDHYRVYEPPRLSDRWALVKSYAGNVLLAWLKAITKPSLLHLALARGTTLGAFHGLTRPPTAKRLTPHINWRADADEALKQAQDVQHVTR